MPQIIAHRGASAYAPENTLAAFALAHRQGAAMLELDVQSTADGQLAVFHDATTERWDGRPRPVHACTMAELARLDIRGERVPTLADVLAFAREVGIGLNLELKVTGIAAACAALIRHFGLEAQVLVSSFLPAALNEMRRCAPALPRAYLMGLDTRRPDVRARELWPFFALQAVGATAWHPYHGLPLLDRVLPLVRQAGYQVNVWTVDDPQRMRALLALGVNGLITNRPDVGRAVLERMLVP